MTEDFKNHAFLCHRNEGASLRLLGDVHILSVFVNDKESAWTAAAEKTYCQAVKTVIESLHTQAKKHGKRLSCCHSCFRMTVPHTHTGNFYSYLPHYFHLKTVGEMQACYEKDLLCHEAPFLFVFNQRGRNYAYEDAKGDGFQTDEYSVIYRPFTPVGIMHELIHQFGGIDYYTPASVKVLAEKHMPYSVMLGNGWEIDDVTAYLIGWKNDLSPHALAFLSQASSLYERDYCHDTK